MDRRQKKTRDAIFEAFIELLSKKHFNKITVGEIIEKADVGRATFYAHFETKDFLLKELCEELFCHIFDANENNGRIFTCNAPSSDILHLLRHLQRNDNNLLDLLACENNELFLRYFKQNLKIWIKKQPQLFEKEKAKGIPEGYWINHLSATFMETVKWWIDNGRKESPEELSEYFFAVI